MEHAFRAWLDQYADNIYPDAIPQAILGSGVTAISYQVISGPRDYIQEGGTDGVTTKRIQVDIWGATPAQTRVIRDALVAASGRIGMSFGSPLVRLQAAFVIDERSAYEPALDQAGPRLFRCSLDFQVTGDV